MKIIELNETQFKNYSRLHSNRNYLQSVEYANIQLTYGFAISYLGLIDDNNNITAACLLLSKKAISKFSYAIAPGGLLVDYTNFELLKNFTDLLREYLMNKDYIYLQVEPRCVISSSNKHEQTIYSSNNIINNLKNIDVHPVDNNNNNKYAIYLKATDITTLYKNFSRTTKRTIQDCNDMGISIYKGNESNMEMFYSLIKKKTKHPIDYYYNYVNNFNNPNNQFEIYFAKLEPKTYLSNATTLLNKEQKNNEKLNRRMKGTKITNGLLNQKISSDKRVQKYNNKLKEAISLFDRYPNGIIISTCAIIKTNNEITFLIDGYEEELRTIRASVLLRYEIIKQYIKQGYTKFNLGFLPKDKNNVNFKHIYNVRMNFGATFVEFPDAFHIIINKFMYNMPILNKSQSRLDT